jgi:DNA-binding transcriptional LysR family regulator
LAEQGSLNPEQMAQPRWILREQGSGTRAVFDRAIQQAGVDVQMVMPLNRQEAIKQSVKAGLGIGCLSQLSVAEELQRGDLVLLKTPLELSRRLSVVVHPESQSNRLVQAFIDFLEL